MNDCIKWDISRDADNIRRSAVRLRGKVAKNLYLPAVSTKQAAEAFLRSARTAWRFRSLRRAELFTGCSISGTVVEIGAGTGWCSSVLSKKKEINKIYAVDYDPISVEEVMPNIFKAFNANRDKITRILGSFNDLNLEDSTIDYVISIGALHHSENIWKTLSESYRVLRPGGTLIACEPCSYNGMTISEQIARENEIVNPEKIEKLYGEDVGNVKVVDNSDHFYRLSTYEAAANYAGFDAYAFIFDATSTSGGKLSVFYRRVRDWLYGDALFSNRKVYRGFQKIVMYPYFAERANRRPVYDDLLLILKRPDN